MVLASHYVLDELLELSGDKKKFEEEFKSLLEKYPDDQELKDLHAKNKDAHEKVVSSLKDLSGLRKLGESGGGTALPFKDRRHDN